MKKEKVLRRKQVIIIVLILSLWIALANFMLLSKASTPSIIWIDFPKQESKQKQEIIIQGWYLSAQKDKTIEFYMDDQNITSQMKFNKRDDVLNSIHGYGTKEENPLPGFYCVIPTQNYKDGKHTLLIKVLQKNTKQELITQTRTFFIQKQETLLQVDFPKQNQKAKSSIEVQGWVMTEAKNAKVQIQLNGKTYTPTRQARPDVLNAISGFGGKQTNLTPGYQITIDMKELPDKNYPVTIQVISETGEMIEQQTKNIVLKKYDTLLQVDFPKQNETVKNSIQVQGWVMTEAKNAKVEVEFNGKTYSPVRQARPDVLNAISGFGGKQTNPMPGYQMTIPTEELDHKTYEVQLKVISETGEMLEKQTRKITVKPYETLLQIDSPKKMKL